MPVREQRRPGSVKAHGKARPGSSLQQDVAHRGAVFVRPRAELLDGAEWKTPGGLIPRPPRTTQALFDQTFLSAERLLAPLLLLSLHFFNHTLPNIIVYKDSHPGTRGPRTGGFDVTLESHRCKTRRIRKVSCVTGVRGPSYVCAQGPIVSESVRSKRKKQKNINRAQRKLSK